MIFDMCSRCSYHYEQLREVNVSLNDLIENQKEQMQRQAISLEVLRAINRHQDQEKLLLNQKICSLEKENKNLRNTKPDSIMKRGLNTRISKLQSLAQNLANCLTIIESEKASRADNPSENPSENNEDSVDTTSVRKQVKLNEADNGGTTPFS